MPFVDCEMGSYGSEETLGYEDFIGIGGGVWFWWGNLRGVGVVETEWRMLKQVVRSKCNTYRI